MSLAKLLDGGEVPDDVALVLVLPRPQNHEAVVLFKEFISWFRIRFESDFDIYDQISVADPVKYPEKI